MKTSHQPKFTLQRGIHHHNHSNHIVIYRNGSNIPRVTPTNIIRFKYTVVTPKYIIQFKYTVTTPKYITLWCESITAPLHRQSPGKSWLTHHLQSSCLPEGGLLNTFLKQNIKHFELWSKAQYMHSCNVKDSLKIYLGSLCNSFGF